MQIFIELKNPSYAFISPSKHCVIVCVYYIVLYTSVFVIPNLIYSHMKTLLLHGNCVEKLAENVSLSA